MPSYTHLAYRRNAKAAARNQQIRIPKNVDALKLAQEDFGFFCEYVADKPPAEHHLEWHKHFITKEDSSCLLHIAGPNVDLLAPRGPLAISMPVATPNGWVPIGDLQLGDLVFSEKGQVTEVIDSPIPEIQPVEVRIPNTELQEKLALEPIKDLKAAIGINDKFQFTATLFNGDEKAFEMAVKTINGFKIYAEAQFWIKSNLREQNKWDETAEVVKAFDLLVKRRFA